MRRKNTHGGGARTNETGLQFERQTNLLDELKKMNYLKVCGCCAYYKEKKVALVTEKQKFYKKFLTPLGVSEKILSGKLLPDSVVVNYNTNAVFIIEKKFQEGSGSVDEKLQTCDFKLKQYKKLLSATDFTANFIFLLNDWYSQKKYKDVLEYIKDVECDYHFNNLPLEAIGLDKSSLDKSS